MGGGASKASVTKDRSKRLFLYSEHALGLRGLEAALQDNPHTVGSSYPFETSDEQTLPLLLKKLCRQHGRFSSIAVASHGPTRPPSPPRDDETFRWSLSKHVVLTDPTELQTPGTPFRSVLEAFGMAVVDNGRVDLLSCGLVGTWAAPPKAFPSVMILGPIEEKTSCRFTAAKNLFAHGGNDIAAAEEWPMDTNEIVDVRASYFLPPEQGGVATSCTLKESQLRQRYVLGDELGRGNFAVVHRAERREAFANKHALPLQPLALKAIDLAKVASRNEVEAEIKIMSMLNHEHILRLFDTIYTERRIYLVLERAEGGELLEVIADAGGVLTEAHAAKILRQLCEALQYMHRLGVVHSDLKPANILLMSRAPDAALKLADFGLSSVVLGVSTHVAHALVGTPDFIAPELLKGFVTRKKYAPALDMWAVGVLLYLLLKGQPPFEAPLQSILFKRITKGEYDRCEGTVWATTSEHAKDLVLKLLVDDPQARLGASEVLVHPFINYASGGDAASLEHAVARLRKYNARRRLQKATRGILAARRLEAATRFLTTSQQSGHSRTAVE